MMTNTSYPCLDRSNELILEVDEERMIIREIQGSYPVEDSLLSDELPYRGGVICHNQHNQRIRVGIYMVYETLAD